MVVDRDIIHGETGEVFNTRFQRIRQAGAVFPFRGKERGERKNARDVYHVHDFHVRGEKQTEVVPGS